MEASQISAMSAHQIREELKKRGVDATGCREKAELVDESICSQGTGRRRAGSHSSRAAAPKVASDRNQ